MAGINGISFLDDYYGGNGVDINVSGVNNMSNLISGLGTVRDLKHLLVDGKISLMGGTFILGRPTVDRQKGEYGDPIVQPALCGPRGKPCPKP